MGCGEIGFAPRLGLIESNRRHCGWISARYWSGFAGFPGLRAEHSACCLPASVTGAGSYRSRVEKMGQLKSTVTFTLPSVGNAGCSQHTSSTVAHRRQYDHFGFILNTNML